MFADELGYRDITTLLRTCRSVNALLTPFMYRRLKKLRGEGGRWNFLLAVDDGNLAAVEQFVAVGVSVNMTDDLADVNHNGCWPTALHVAATRGNAQMVQRLLDLGADLDAVDWTGARPMHKAATSYSSNAATVRCLLEAGQNLDITDFKERTPLHLAAELGRTENVRALLEIGADVSAGDYAGHTPLVYALRSFGNKAIACRILYLYASRFDPDIGEYMVPARQNRDPDHKTIETLLAGGADSDIYDGSNVLRWAADCFQGRYNAHRHLFFGSGLNYS